MESYLHDEYIISYYTGMRPIVATKTIMRGPSVLACTARDVKVARAMQRKEQFVVLEP